MSLESITRSVVRETQAMVEAWYCLITDDLSEMFWVEDPPTAQTPENETELGNIIEDLLWRHANMATMTARAYTSLRASKKVLDKDKAREAHNDAALRWKAARDQAGELCAICNFRMETAPFESFLGVGIEEAEAKMRRLQAYVDKLKRISPAPAPGSWFPQFDREKHVVDVEPPAGLSLRKKDDEIRELKANLAKVGSTTSN